MTALLPDTGLDPTPGTGPVPRTAVGRLVADYRPRALVGPTGGATLATLLYVSVVDDADALAFATLLPEIRAAFGLSLQGVLTVQAVAGPVAIGAALLAGYLADRVRRSRLLAAAVAVWALAVLLIGLAGSVWLLGIAVAASALARATAGPTVQSLVTDAFPVHSRARLFSLRSAIGQLDVVVVPVLVGLLATLAGFRLPFLLLVLPLALAAVLCLRLRDPVRGEPDRRALGLHGPAATTAPPEPAPSLAESWRIAVSVPTLRRVWISLPMLVGAAAGTAGLLSTLLDERFGLGPAQRGLVQSTSAVAGVVGILLGARLADRLLLRAPGRVLVAVGLAAAAAGVLLVGQAFAPNLAVYVTLDVVQALLGAVVAPAMFTVVSLVLPARARGFGLASAAVFVLPGLLFLPVAGALGDAYGAPAAVAALGPLYLLGAVILAGANGLVDGDLRSALTAALARGEDGPADGLPGPRLTVRDLRLARDGSAVLDGVDLQVRAGEVVALVSDNGAGKTSLLEALAGVLIPAGGVVRHDGVDTTFTPAAERARGGLCLAPAGRRLFPDLTVAEHLALVAFPAERLQPAHGWFPELLAAPARTAGELSAGQSHQLGLLLCWLSRPRTALLDELTYSQPGPGAHACRSLVRALAAEGCAVLVVEQSSQDARAVADRVLHLQDGRLLPDSGLAAATSGLRRSRAGAGDTVLTVQGLRVVLAGRALLDGVDVRVHAGEIVALTGGTGSGKTLLLDALSGVVPVASGRALLHGSPDTDLLSVPATERAALGVHRAYADARLFPALTVDEHVALLPASRGAQQFLERAGADRLGHRLVGSLSAGQRRRVALALALAWRPRLLLLDEPTAAVRRGDLDELLRMIADSRDVLRCGVLIVEHHPRVLTGLADTVLTLRDGRLHTPDPTTT